MSAYSHETIFLPKWKKNAVMKNDNNKCERSTHSLVSVMLVSGANGWMPATPGGDEVRDPCRDDSLFVDVIPIG